MQVKEGRGEWWREVRENTSIGIRDTLKRNMRLGGKLGRMVGDDRGGM